MGKICLCEHCIAAIQSRGEKLFVGDMVEGMCEWCDEETEDLFDCKIDSND